MKKVLIVSITAIFLMIGCGSDSAKNNDLANNDTNLTKCDITETIVIGTQTWAAKNCYADAYPNGEAINSWKEINTMGAIFSYAETGAGTNTENVKGAPANAEWGNLYQWEAAVNCTESNATSTDCEKAQGICPVGWHVPSHQEFRDLFHFLDSTVDESLTDISYTGTNAGTQTKEGTDFNAKLSGHRSDFKVFGNRDTVAHFWTSNQQPDLTPHVSTSSNAWQWSIQTGRGDVSRSGDGKTYGFSVRCIKD